MTIEECYSDIEGDYGDVLRRLGTKERVERFLVKFTEDDCYINLEQAFKNKDGETAFRAAHSLKGVCANLGISTLYRSAAALADELRDGQFSPRAEKMMERVTKDYGVVREIIDAFAAQGA